MSEEKPPEVPEEKALAPPQPKPGFVDHDAVKQLMNTPDSELGALKDDKDVYRVQMMGDTKEIIEFSQAQYTFMQALVRTNNPALAAAEAGVTLEQAKSWLSHGRVMKHLLDKRFELAQAEGVTREWIIAMAYQVLTGQTKFDRSKREVWQALLKTYFPPPKPEKKEEPVGLDKVLKAADSFTITLKKKDKTEVIEGQTTKDVTEDTEDNPG